MTFKAYTIWDSKAEAFCQPFFFPTKGAAIRAFQTTATDNKTQMNKYPGDYTLFEVGEFNDSTGVYENLHSKINLGCAIEFLKESTQ